MKKYLAALIILINANVQAASCLITSQCFEYNGQLIDMRSNAARALDELSGCDPLTQDCLSADYRELSPRLNQDEFTTLVGKEGSELFVPLEVSKADLNLLVGALSLGTILFKNDQAIMDYIQDHRTETTESVASISNLFGREAIAPIAAGAYFIGAVMDNGKLKNIGLFTVSAGLATQIVTEAFKKSFQRVRPNTAETPYEFFEDGNNSFFSGHTSAAFSLATVIAHTYKDKPLVPFLAYGTATLTAYARMHDKKHWASDVLIGAIAGHLVTKIMMRTFERSDKAAQSGLLITPYFDSDPYGNNNYGISISWQKRKKKSELRCSKLGLEGRDLIRACLSETFNAQLN